MTFTTNPYITVPVARSVINSSSTVDDNYLNFLIGAAQTAIDNYCGYPFQQDGTSGSPVTRVFDGNDGQILIIEHCQLIHQVLENIQNVTTDSNGNMVLTAQQLDITADVVLGPPNTLPGYRIQRITGTEFSSGLQNIIISGVWGYPGVPADVTIAAGFLVAHYYGLRDTYYADVLVQGTQTLKYSKQIPVHVREILDRYRSSYFTSGNAVN